MPHRLIIAQDVQIVALILELSGFIEEIQNLEQVGPNTEIHDLTDERLSRLEFYLGAADVQFYYATSSHLSSAGQRSGRHAAP